MDLGVTFTLLEGCPIYEVMSNIVWSTRGTVTTIAHINLILTTAFLSVDRYIAVKYKIHYQNILTVSRMFYVLTSLWVLSILVAGIPWLNVKVFHQFYRNRLIASILFQSMVSVLLLSRSKYANIIRNQHIRKIEERQNYFGIERERLDILRVVKKSLTDSFKLYMANVAVMAISTFIGIIELILNENVISMKVFFILILHIMDVAVVSLTQREIRIQMKRTFRMCCCRYVAATSVVDSNVSNPNEN